jgi:acyl-CoA thioester hydrolase
MKIRVYYEDTDCGNVVYYANYLKYMERGRTELMRERGVTFARYHKEGLMFVVAEASLKYHAPAVYDDLLDMETRAAAVSPVSIVFQTTIRNEKGFHLVTGEVKVACVNREGKVRRIPAEILERISQGHAKE